MDDMSARYKYVKRLADSASAKAKELHLEYQQLYDDEGPSPAAAGKLNDFFYWIGHANAYRGIALQVDFMETVEEEKDAEGSCP